MRWVFNLILLILCLYLIQDLSQKTEKLQNSEHAFQKLPWNDFTGASFKDGFRLIRQEKAYILRGPRTPDIPIPTSLVQKWLDNWLLLPNPKLKPLVEEPSAYGFSEKPDVILEFVNQKTNFSLGHFVPGEADMVYARMDQQFFPLYSMFSENFSWPEEKFIPRDPLSLPCQIFNLLHGPHNLPEGFRSFPAQSPPKTQGYWDIRPLLEALMNINATPLCDQPSPESCIDFFQLDDRSICSSPQGLYDRKFRILWDLSPNLKDLLSSWQLYFFSPRPADYLNPSELQSMHLCGFEISSQNRLFSSSLNHLASQKPTLMAPQTIGAPCQIRLQKTDGNTLVFEAFRKGLEIGFIPEPDVMVLLKLPGQTKE